MLMLIKMELLLKSVKPYLLKPVSSVTISPMVLKKVKTQQ